MRVIGLIDQHGLVATSEEMSAQPMSRMEAHRVGAEQPLHPTDQITEWRFHHEMEMIAHQAVGMHLPIAFRTGFGQGFYPELSICIFPNNLVAVSAAVHHVIDSSLVLDPRLAGHACLFIRAA